MATRSKAKPLSTHDRKVRQVVRDLEKQGYRVRADVRGREKPRPIGLERVSPDIVAERAGRRLIIEIETPGSQVRDVEQIKTFARYASEKADTTFRLVVTKPRKK